MPATSVKRPVRLLLDTDDDHAVDRSAHQWADPARRRITVEPTPHTTSPAHLALDVLRAMGREGYFRPEAERMSTNPAWRAVTCWTLTTGIRDVIVLRAHRLSAERLRRLAVWVAQTGIRLTLLAHTPQRDGERSLLEHLTAAGLDPQVAARGTTCVLDAIGPAAGRRTGSPPHDHTYRLPPLPHSPVPVFREDCRRRLNPADFAHTDGQYRAGYAAARTWLARTQPPRPENTPTTSRRDERTPFSLQQTEALRLFLARLTVSSPSPQHTLARVRGAQAGFLSRSTLLDVPHDLTTRTGPGITTKPLTPQTVHTITTRLPNPLRAAAIAALLFTGTDTSLLSMTQTAGIEHAHSTLAIDRDSRINIGEPPGPRHMYAVPPRARPLLQTAVAFRRRTPRTYDHHGLFANCFGTTPRFEALIADVGLPIPALARHAGDDWHTATHAWHLHTPAPRTSDFPAPF
ncbi:hypothetical protein [Streptomyces showdoensis]|uniref:Uncharacterized protein n=2 Tax=Streptomyces showdoensis TaxID=68268 RepID=A0A2P2GEK4_STREW|nr:hypothetical protein VO63_31530 [Streptomyces showdoensis]